MNRDYEPKAIVRIEVTEYRGELSKGAEYDFWGSNSHAPVFFIRVREGDAIEFHFKPAAHSTNTQTAIGITAL